MDKSVFAAKKITFWFPLIWIVTVILSSSSADWWSLTKSDEMDWNNPSAVPGTVTIKIIENEKGEVASHQHTYWLGTDTMGRDIASRLIYGARISLMVGLLAPLIGFFIGGLLGCIAGYFGGRSESFIMALMDIVLAFPGLVLLLLITFYLGSNLTNLILVLGFLSVPSFSRVARANTLKLRKQEFIDAARIAGASNTTILFREIIPNVIVPLAIYGLLAAAFMIMAEGALSFLGLGVPAPTPSWGSMIAEGREVLEESPHVSMIPALVLFLTVVSFNLLGDGLRSLFQTRKSQI